MKCVNIVSYNRCIAKMDSKSSQWRPGPTVCRCCLSEGCYKDISTEYFWMGKREVYEELLLETLDLSVSLILIKFKGVLCYKPIKFSWCLCAFSKLEMCSFLIWLSYNNRLLIFL